MNKVIVNVYLKKEILDPQGRAISEALFKLGLLGVRDVRQGKQFVIEFQQLINNNQILKIQELAGSLLSNPIIEDFTIEVKNES